MAGTGTNATLRALFATLAAPCALAFAGCAERHLRKTPRFPALAALSEIDVEPVDDNSSELRVATHNGWHLVRTQSLSVGHRSVQLRGMAAIDHANVALNTVIDDSPWLFRTLESQWRSQRSLDGIVKFDRETLWLHQPWSDSLTVHDPATATFRQGFPAAGSRPFAWDELDARYHGAFFGQDAREQPWQVVEQIAQGHGESASSNLWFEHFNARGAPVRSLLCAGTPTNASSARLRVRCRSEGATHHRGRWFALVQRSQRTLEDYCTTPPLCRANCPGILRMECGVRATAPRTRTALFVLDDERARLVLDVAATTARFVIDREGDVHLAFVAMASATHALHYALLSASRRETLTPVPVQTVERPAFVRAPATHWQLASAGWRVDHDVTVAGSIEAFSRVISQPSRFRGRARFDRACGFGGFSITVSTAPPNAGLQVISVGLRDHILFVTDPGASPREPPYVRTQDFDASVEHEYEVTAQNGQVVLTVDHAQLARVAISDSAQITIQSNGFFLDVLNQLHHTVPAALRCPWTPASRLQWSEIDITRP